MENEERFCISTYKIPVSKDMQRYFFLSRNVGGYIENGLFEKSRENVRNFRLINNHIKERKEFYRLLVDNLLDKIDSENEKYLEDMQDERICSKSN